MTNEESIKRIQDFIGWFKKDSDIYEALDIAIQALSQEPCEDAISREAVLEQINCWIGSGEYRYTNATYYLTERIKHISSAKPQEPCEDDGVDHEKIRKAFAKESDIKKADIADMIPKVIMQVEEERDRFIFNTIRPYCEEITQQEISKEILSKALTQYFSKPTECDDAISRDAVLDALLDYWHDIYFVDGSGYDVYEDCKDVIDELPSVTQKSETVTEFADRCRECGAKYGKMLKQKSGKWEDLHRCWVCSECGQQTHIEHKYCPNCGCRMVEPQESEDKAE